MDMKLKKIFKRKIALELMGSKKHNFLYTEPNREKNNLSVFVFEETEALLNDLTEITNRDYK